MGPGHRHRRAVPEDGGEAGLREGREGADLGGVDDDRLARLPADEERDDAVRARGRALEDALRAIDHEHLLSHDREHAQGVCPGSGPSEPRTGSSAAEDGEQLAGAEHVGAPPAGTVADPSVRRRHEHRAFDRLLVDPGEQHVVGLDVLRP